MTAGFSAMQGSFVALSVAALALLGSAPFALGLAVSLLVWSVAMGVTYLSSRRANRPAFRPGEVTVLLAWLVGAGVPGTVAAVVAFGSVLDVRSPSTLAFSLTIGPLAAFLTIMFASSLVDWYYTTPRLSGLVREPPCRSPNDDVWLRLTGIWYAHRWFTAFAVVAGITIALGALTGIAFYLLVMALLETWDVGTAKEPIAALAASLGGLAVMVGGWLRAFASWFPGDYGNALRRVSTLALHPPYAVGRYVAVRPAAGAAKKGYVLDVAVEGIKLVPLSEITTAGKQRGIPRWMTIRTAELADATITPIAGSYCSTERCLRINDKYCLRSQQRPAGRATT
jgi:hypothetical protein